MSNTKTRSIEEIREVLTWTDGAGFRHMSGCSCEFEAGGGSCHECEAFDGLLTELSELRARVAAGMELETRIAELERIEPLYMRVLDDEIEGRMERCSVCHNETGDDERHRSDCPFHVLRALSQKEETE